MHPVQKKKNKRKWKDRREGIYRQNQQSYEKEHFDRILHMIGEYTPEIIYEKSTTDLSKTIEHIQNKKEKKEVVENERRNHIKISTK